MSGHGNPWESHGGRGGYGGGRGGGHDYYGRDRGSGGRGDFRGGGGRGGRDYRGGGGGRGPPQPDLTKITKVKTNYIIAAITPENFDFRMYTCSAKNRNGEEIQRFSRKGFLFSRAIFDKLLADEPKNEKKELKRSVFFQGSVFFSKGAIEELELESASFPLQILDGSETDGDTFTVVGKNHFKAPKVLTETIFRTDGEQPLGKDDERLSFDCRCRDCSKGFGDVKALLQHCRIAGHMPAYSILQAGANTAVEAEVPIFIQYLNVLLARALEQGGLAKWGRDYYDPTKFKEPTGRDGPLGATVFTGYNCEFILVRPNQPSPATLVLAVDMRAKVMRTTSVLEEIYGGRDPATARLARYEEDQVKRKWIGTDVIYKLDKKTYTIEDLLFDKTPDSLLVEGLEIKGEPCSHTRYFEERKNTRIKYPNVAPMVAVLNKRGQQIFLPAELVCDLALDPRVKEELPKIASFSPSERAQAVHDIYATYLGNWKKNTGAGLLASCGVRLQHEVKDEKAKVISAKAYVLPIPQLVAARVPVPPDLVRKGNWARSLKPARYDTSQSRGPIVNLNTVVFYHEDLEGCARGIYQKIASLVADFNTRFTLNRNPEMIKVNKSNDPFENPHPSIIRQYFSSERPENTFVMDFITLERGSSKDPNYLVIKKMLGESGFLSQFLNLSQYKRFSFDDSRIDRKIINRINMILQCLARQILSKSGVRLWWTSIPASIPLPLVMVGVDVYHAPREYNPQTKERCRKNSCAAIVVEVFRGHEATDRMEIYCETFSLRPKTEFGLEDPLTKTISEALRLLDVPTVGCCIVWRDGISESSFDIHAQDEIASVRRGLEGVVKQEIAHSGIPMAYIVCQKKIATKFFVETKEQPGEVFGAPSGTAVVAVQGLSYSPFYIQGRAPPGSTPKPVRFIVINKDPGICSESDLVEVTWNMCHDYPNWTGPIKVPAVVMGAHKLAMLAGTMTNSGESINHRRFQNKMPYL